MLTQEEIKRAEQELREKEVDIDLVIDSVYHIYFNESMRDEMIYTLDEYKEYLKKIQQLKKEDQKLFLETLKLDEILVTQLIEKKDYEIILNSMMDDNIRKDSIDYLVRKVLSDKPVNTCHIKFVHKIIMDGTLNKSNVSLQKINNYRGNDLSWVGGWVNGKPVIQYAPPKSEKIQPSLEKIIDFMNDESYHKTEFDCFVHPIIVHALIAILQPFYDGNTRVCRLLQSIYFLLNTNRVYNLNYSLPLLAMSQEYYAFSSNYRSLIANIAMNPNQENWEQWIMYNLRNIQSCIIRMGDTIDNNFNIYKK